VHDFFQNRRTTRCELNAIWVEIAELVYDCTVKNNTDNNAILIVKPHHRLIIYTLPIIQHTIYNGAECTVTFYSVDVMHRLYNFLQKTFLS